MSEKDKNKIYLGDSVYADLAGSMIILTTNNGMGASNTICLEPEVLVALVDYANHTILTSANYVLTDIGEIEE